jgi:hypothetical protein
MKKLIIITSILLILTSCSLYNKYFGKPKSPLLNYNYTVITAKTNEITNAKDFDKKFQLNELDDFIKLIAEKSEDTKEYYGIETDSITKILTNNFGYKTKQAQNVIKNYTKPRYIYTTHSYSHHWVKEWIILIRDNSPTSSIKIPDIE